MCIAFEIGMIIAGIVALAQGKFRLSRNKVVTGGPAYFIGVLLILAFPMYLVSMFALGIILGLSGQLPKQDELEGVSVMLLFVVTLGMVIPCVVVAVICGAPENNERHWERALDDFDEDGPTRRRRRPRGDDDFQ